MKESKFNVYYNLEDGTRLAFNSLTCALAVVDSSYSELIELLPNLNSESLPEHLRECYSCALNGHFIVDDDCNEIQELTIKRNYSKYYTGALGLTIAPTLSCNFKCIYCYETSKSGVMSEKTQNELIAFVVNQIKNLKSLDISWYGGEPLLAKNIVYDLSSKLIDLCNSNNVEYNAYIVSNGSLLDDETIDRLVEYKVRGIQITLDGTSEIHNKRRQTKSGKESFDIILSNINRVLQTEKIDVSIRINIDKSNSLELENLISYLSTHLVSKKVKISFGQVTAYTEACKSIETSCFDNQEFSIEILKYYYLLEKYAFNEYNNYPYPHLMLNYCCAELLNSFVVDHEGYLYKCWNEVGNVEHSVGNVSDTHYDLTNYKNAKWVERTPYAEQACSECSLLPVCMGGCPYNDIVLKQGNKCDMIKYNNKEIMVKYYKQNQD